MAGINAAIQITDRLTPAFRTMTESINVCLGTFAQMQAATGQAVDTSAIQAAQVAMNDLNMAVEGISAELNDMNKAAEGVSAELNDMNKAAESVNSELNDMAEQAAMNNKLYKAAEYVSAELNDIAEQQEQFNQTMQRGTGNANSLVKALMGMSVVRSVISTVTGQLGAALNRMDTMTNYNRTMTAITGSSEAAAYSLGELKEITKGTAYGLDTAASSVQNFVTRGMNISAATAEVGKWADAVAFYGKGTNEALSTVTDALGKMLSKGKVEMEQLNRITDNGINAVGIYAQATGRSAAAVQADLSKGKISAQNFITTVSTAFEEGTNGVLNISGAAKAAGGTWETSIANAKAAVTRGLISLIDGINQGLTNAGFGTILEDITAFGATTEVVLGNIGTSAGNTITMLSPMLNMLKDAGTFVADNWSIIAPIILGVAGAVTIYNGALATHNMIQGISNGLKTIAAINAVAHGTATAAEMAATTGMTAAQLSLNAAILACPLTWIVVGIIAVIAAIYAGVAAYNKFTGASISATGIVAGVFAVLGAFIYNSFIVPTWNRFAAIANFIGNVFNDPAAAIKVCIYDMAQTSIGYILNMARAIEDIINKIPGVEVNITAGLDSFYNKIEEASQKTKDAAGWKEYVGKKEYIDYSDAAAKGYNFGKGLVEKFTQKDTANPYTGTGKYDAAAGISQDTAATAGNTKKIEKNTEISSEDLKYLRDIAERDIIDRTVFRDIKVDLGGVVNNVKEVKDLDGIAAYIGESVSKELLISAEGVH